MGLSGLLELTTALLLAYRPSRLWGAGLGSAVMLAAAATVLRHGEYTHAVAPIVVLLMALTVGSMAWRDRRSVTTAA